MTVSIDSKSLRSIFCGGSEFPHDDDDGSSSSPGILSENGILRNAGCPNGELVEYTSAGTSVKTLYDSFQYGVQRHPHGECLGKRTDAHSPFSFKTYQEIQTEAAAIGSYLKHVLDDNNNSSSKEQQQPNHTIGFSGKNAPEYLTAIHGCFHAGLTTVPIYDTFGETECTFIMEQTKTPCVFVSAENVNKLLSWTKPMTFVKKIIVWGSSAITEAESIIAANREDNNNETKNSKDESAFADKRVITYEECVKQGLANMMDATPPSPDDLAIIMYTSGTTGMPKGVMLPHSALLATVASGEAFFEDNNAEITNDDVFLSYLPLAHVFDFFCECFLLFKGAKIGYFRGDQKTLVDDIQELKPTMFVGVPRVFERIYKTVNAMIEGGSSIKKFLFHFFYEQKRSALANGVKFDKASYIGDQLVFSKFKQRLGGRVRIIISGGAPLSHHVEEWLKVTMCCPVTQGYGLTETCAASCVATPDRMEQMGTVGPPLYSLEVKLDPIPEMGYDGTPEGGGEICFRGHSVMKGYYLRPDLTKEVLDSDGWFHSGDIGKFVHGGCVKIVDRKKQLFKLSQGEYVSPEKVEGVASKSPLIGQIFVHGTSTEAVLIAVVVPSGSAIHDYGGKEAAIQSKALKKAIVEDLDRVCRSEKLKGYEIPKGVILHGDEFTPESGFVTPSFKLKRPAIQKHYSKEIDELYLELSKRHG